MSHLFRRVATPLGSVGVISAGCLLLLCLLECLATTESLGTSQRAAKAPPKAPLEYSVVGTGRASGPLRPGQPRWFSSLVLHPDGRWLISDELILGGDETRQRPF